VIVVCILFGCVYDRCPVHIRPEMVISRHMLPFPSTSPQQIITCLPMQGEASGLHSELIVEAECVYQWHLVRSRVVILGW
jgi:hypothetical protein